MLNSSNRKLWRILHDLLRPCDHVTWIVTLAPVGFYLAVPKDFAPVLLTKLKSHEQWAHSTMQEADPPVLTGETYWLRLERHDVFSLTIDYTRQTSPIRELLTAIHELEPNEKAAFAIRLSSVPVERWKGICEYAWNVWRAGGMPQRSEFDPKRMLRLAGTGVKAVAGEILSLAEDVVRAVGKVCFGDDGPERHHKTPWRDPDRLDDPSTASRQKRHLPVYRAWKALIVDSHSEPRRRMIAHSMFSAFSELAGDNRLIMAPGRSLLSTDEVGRLIQLPTADVQAEYKLEAIQQVEVRVPDAFKLPGGIYAGESVHRGERTAVYWPVSDPDWAATPRIFMGAPRMGKDTAIVNWLVEANEQGIGAVVLDVIDERHGHRGMGDALRDHLPAERVIDLNLADFEYPVYVGPLLIPTSGFSRVSAGNMADVVASYFLDGEQGDLHQTEGVLTEAAKLVRGDILGIKRILTDKQFRTKMLAKGREEGMDLTSLEDYHACSEGRQGMIASPVLNRIGHILRSEALRPIFCQRPNPALRLSEWIQTGKVVIYRIPNRPDAFGERGAQLLCHWLVLTVFLIKQSVKSGITYLVLNEPHQYLSPGFVRFCERMLAEGPKYRLAPIFAFHYFRQFRGYDGLVDALLAANTNWHLFRNSSAREYERLKPLLEPVFTPEEALANTRAYEYIALWLDEERRHTTPFIVQAPPPVWKRCKTRDNSHLTHDHARKYGRPFHEVEAEIRKRR